MSLVPPRAVVHADVQSFTDRALPLLMHDEARANLMLGIVNTIAEQPHVYSETFLATIERGDDVISAVIRTPPYGAVLADVDGDVAETAGMIAAVLVEHFPDLPGVLGNVPVAATVAHAVEDRTGLRAQRRFEQGVYAASAVVTARQQAPGRPRRATIDDRDLVMR